MIESEITILGAGPAGSTAALFLSNFGISCALIDKSAFPRDKVCGDCLGGYVISVLRQLGEDIFNRFIDFSEKSEGKGVLFYSPDLVKLSVPATETVEGRIREVSLSRREDFDNFLFNEAANKKEISIHCGIDVHGYSREKNSLIFFDRKGEKIIKTKLSIIATGSQSKIAGDLSSYRVAKNHLAGGVRCYYENVKGDNEKGYIEFHFLREILPGYLWIFPLNEVLTNVGIGQRSDIIAKNKTDLKKVLPSLIENYPHLRERFKDARMITPPAGFPLALGSVRRKISGDNFMLTGDAASLIEPFFGEGIGNAMYSGMFAAEQARLCLKENNFSASFNKAYDTRVFNKMGNALRMSTMLQKAASYPRLVNRVFHSIEKKPALQNMLFKIINGDIAREPGMGIEFLIRSVIGI